MRCVQSLRFHHIFADRHFRKELQLDCSSFWPISLENTSLNYLFEVGYRTKQFDFRHLLPQL